VVFCGTAKAVPFVQRVFPQAVSPGLDTKHHARSEGHWCFFSPVLTQTPCQIERS
jgi:hypothetical protein